MRIFKTNKAKNIFWAVVLVLSTGIFAALLLPAMNIYLGWHVPFFTGGYQAWTYLWWEIPTERQWGLVMTTALFAMLPGRLMCLAVMKLCQPIRYNENYDIWGEHGNYNSMYFYDEKGDRMTE